MPYSELIIALENINDKVSTVPSSKSRRHDTSAPMEIGMAAREDGENVSQEGDQRIMELALQAVYEGTGKGKWGFGKGQNWTREVWQSRQGWRKEPLAERQWQERRQRARERRQGRNQNVLDVRNTEHIAAWCRKGGNKNLYATGEDGSETAEESVENEEDVQAR